MKKTKESGITLIALIITIVVMLILATVTIEAINGGLFEYAGQTKSKTDIVTEKAAITQAFSIAKGTSISGTVSENAMNTALDKTLGGGQATVEKSGNIITISITGTTRSYLVNDTTGEISESE